MTSAARAEKTGPSGPLPTRRGRFLGRGRSEGESRADPGAEPEQGRPPDGARSVGVPQQPPDAGGEAAKGPAVPADLPGQRDPGTAAAVLERSRRLVDPGLRRSVDALPLGMRRVARYHFGWEHADGTPAAGNAGKAVRPALVIEAAEALGGDPREALAAAVAVELTHNFSLLHDDVMDRDRTRRHRPTAWTVFGVPDAILAGDALQARAQLTLVEDTAPVADSASARLAACVIELCEGQHIDTALEQRSPTSVELDEVLTMAEAKTGALLGCACALGGLYAGAGDETVDSLDEFGRQAGLAFQLIDDIIGIWGDPKLTGKPAGADLLVRKKSLPVVAALTAGGKQSSRLAELYSRPVGETDLEATVAAVEAAGGREWAQQQAAEHMSRAIEHLQRAVPDPADADPLLAMAEFITRRKA